MTDDQSVRIFEFGKGLCLVVKVGRKFHDFDIFEILIDNYSQFFVFNYYLVKIFRYFNVVFCFFLQNGQ